jgi:hypothetical protein
VFYDEISEAFDKVPDGNIHQSHVLECADKLEKIVHRVDPNFAKQLQVIREERPIVTFLRGTKMSPDFTISDIPQDISETYDEAFNHKIVPNRMSLIAYNMLLGISPTLDHPYRIAGYVFPTKEHESDVGSAHSSRVDLGWHVDGWQLHDDHPNHADYAALHCIIGHKEVKTEIITANQLLESLSQETLEALKQQYYMSDSGIKRPVLDENGKMSFTQNNLITKDAADITNYRIGCVNFDDPAMKELYEKIATMQPAFTEALESGDLLLQKNRNGIHRRVQPSSTTMQDSNSNGIIGKRLVLRQAGIDTPPKQ